MFLYEHNKPKEHKEIDDYLTVRGMTYYDYCSKEIRNDEWSKHKNHPGVRKAPTVQRQTIL